MNRQHLYSGVVMRKSNLQIEIECCENWMEIYAERRALRELIPLNQRTRQQRSDERKERAMWQHLLALRGKAGRR